MPLPAGTRLGAYEIVAVIGAGGMGEVYKATDTRLNRTVAVKVMPPHFANDPEMKRRFDREAQTIAGLNHPHICTLHDVGEDNGVNFLVLEYLEGETVAERLASDRRPASTTSGSGAGRPIDLGDALRIARDIADALDKAHRQGVIHRDLKPANVMLAKGGTARQGSTQTKLLDFGLAKWTPHDESESLAAMPTRMDVTTPGTVLGTMQYMSPEQVEGKEADARSDIFAFGALVYEIVTGRKAFDGKSQATLIGSIMTGQPRPMSHVVPATPPALDHIIERCLAKDPEARWQTAHDLLMQLEWVAKDRAGANPSAAAAPDARRRDRIAMLSLGLAGALIAGLSVPSFFYLRGPADPEPIQFRTPVVGLSQSDTAVSPDGKSIAFVARPDPQGSASLYVRPVNSMVSKRLAYTDDASQPFWSPESSVIGYVVADKLKTVDATSGARRDVCSAPGFSGGAWSKTNGGTIVFGLPKGLFAVSAQSGTPAPVTEVAQGETGHLWPSVLPDGRSFLDLAWSADAASRSISVASLDSKDAKGTSGKKKLMDAESSAVYVPGYVLFHREATLFARAFDAKSQAFTADPVFVAAAVSSSGNGRSHFSASDNGVVLYFYGGGGRGVGGRGRAANEQFAFVNRSGASRRTAVETGTYGDIDLSPDGKLIAITRQTEGSADIQVVDWEQAKSSRLTQDPADNVDPIWSPDGKKIAFTLYRKGNADVFVKNANGVGEDVPLLQSPKNEMVKDWSKDDKYIAFQDGDDEFHDIYALPLFGDRKPFPVVTGHFHKNEPQFSYDGKWLAYASDENVAGKFQVYVISFPGGAIKQQISTDGGGQPRWRRDGHELFYRADRDIMAVDLKLGAKVEPGAPHSLFPTPTPGAGNVSASSAIRHQWAVDPDGQRFLVRIPPGGRGSASAQSAADDGPLAPNTYTPAGQTRVSGRGGLTTAGVGSNLTVILNWPSLIRNSGK